MKTFISKSNFQINTSYYTSINKHFLIFHQLIKVNTKTGYLFIVEECGEIFSLYCDSIVGTLNILVYLFRLLVNFPNEDNVLEIII